MIILPAIDLKDGKCVRLFQGDYATAEQVAEDPVKTAQSFEEQGARWVHLVDLDGAKARRPVNDSTVFSIRDNVSMNIEVGGGIRDMDTVEYYLSHHSGLCGAAQPGVRARGREKIRQKDRRRH